MLQQTQQVSGIKDFFNLMPSLCGCGPDATLEQHQQHHSEYMSSSSSPPGSYSAFPGNHYHRQQIPIHGGDYVNHSINNNTINEAKDLSMQAQSFDSIPLGGDGLMGDRKKENQQVKENFHGRKSRSPNSGATCNKSRNGTNEKPSTTSGMGYLQEGMV